ncbi:DUF3306 domain-containing protein [Halovulum dunhuangense]|uniref:DUF3306 domain-containing protein n=1 Tax=Halovulum dunhuangense TaxID=1505036 RepID=A0A849L2B3_9RHOB|nr:DUF3306 domain-containing protein [Halovulum dunhuangense]NNU80380.1 DUF3306 domain-containing protein [Halovulum dunhuangense]
MSARSGDFWSRRKARVAAEEAAEAKAAEATEESRDRDALESMPDEEALEKLGLPDPDTLQAGDDFSAFLRGAVPERIRRRALRRLWISNPIINAHDGLTDYADDYRAMAEASSGVVATVYQVGKGLLPKVLADEAAAAPAQSAPAARQAPPEPAAESPADGAESPKGKVETPSAGPDAEAPATAEQASAETLPAPRRMRFHFSD